MQLEPKKNMLETLLRDNLEQRREELKKVPLGWLSEGSGLLFLIIISSLFLPLFCVAGVGVHLCGGS